MVSDRLDADVAAIVDFDLATAEPLLSLFILGCCCCIFPLWRDEGILFCASGGCTSDVLIRALRLSFSSFAGEQ